MGCSRLRLEALNSLGTEGVNKIAPGKAAWPTLVVTVLNGRH